MIPTALIVLNPRQISECIEAIEALDIDICWIQNMSEYRAAQAVNQAIANSKYDRYVILSDDCVPTQAALDRVLYWHDTGSPVVTGFCNLDRKSPFCNLSYKKLGPPPPNVRSYEFMETQYVMGRTGPVATKFAGLALTCMSRNMWFRFPLAITSKGGQMDYQLSWRLQQAGYPIVAPPDAFIYHVKEVWNKLDRAHEKRLLIGEEPAGVKWRVQ